MSRFFIAGPCAEGAEVELAADDVHHVADVLRLGVGDRVVLLDAGAAWDAELVGLTKRSARARVIGLSTETGGELPASVTVFQALIKGAKFDDVVEKVVELGAQRIVPVRCARSYSDASAAKVERWRRIARSAAQQSRRLMVPTVDDPIAWDAVLERSPAMRTIVAWEGAARGSFGEAVATCRGVSSLAIAIGPEGSFTDEEIAAARDAKCIFVSLGPTILRTETAAPVLLAALASGCSWW